MTVNGEAQAVTIRLSEFDGKAPYPYHIDGDGLVLRQDFWKGRPYQLVGFQFADGQVGAIGLEFDAFWDEPTLALGMYPVFVNGDGSIETIMNPIERASRGASGHAAAGRCGS